MYKEEVEEGPICVLSPKVAKVSVAISCITNGREPRSCLGRVFNFKLGSFTDNTKIVQHANGHF